MEWALCRPSAGFLRAAVLALGIGSLSPAYGQGSTLNQGNRSYPLCIRLRLDMGLQQHAFK